MMLQIFYLQARPQLKWLQTDWPPHQIVDGPYQAQGTFDLLQQQIIVLLPQFNHQNRLVSLPRLEQIFIEGEDGHCSVGTLYSAERANSRLFSKPVAAGPALAVGYISGLLNQHSALQTDGMLIGSLVQDPNLRGVYQPNRYYPDVVMAAVQQTGSNLNSYPFTSEVNAVALLASQRVDYVVEYPERLEYFKKLLAADVALEHRAIVDANIASVSYITCTKDAIGQAVIAAIDQVLPQLWQQPAYTDAMQHWLDDSARRRLSNDISRLQQEALMEFKPRPDDPVNPGHQ
tara:strand:+ start:1939 stop:2805 length:867 start_codon:yes stop_codon:yes gene_type:complete